MDVLKYVAIYVLVIVCAWLIGSFFADNVSDHKIIKPEPGVSCVVVSRMFNTSVSCWKD